jgi:hypothetical protein
LKILDKQATRGEEGVKRESDLERKRKVKRVKKKRERSEEIRESRETQIFTEREN